MKGTVAVDWAAELVGVASEAEITPTSIAGAELTNPETKRVMMQEEVIILDRSLTCKSLLIQSNWKPFYTSEMAPRVTSTSGAGRQLKNA
jgi:hypothetical protein